MPPQTKCGTSQFRTNDTEILGAQSFRTEDEVLESSSDDDIALIQNYADHQVGEYQQILRRDKAVKEVAKIVLNERRGIGFAVSTSTSNHITHLRSVHEIELKTKNSEIKVYKKLSYATEELASIQKDNKDDGLIDMLLQSNDIAESLQLEEEFGLSIEKVQGEGSTTLKNSNDTRWNTLLYMFRSFSKNFNAINIALIKAGKKSHHRFTRPKIF
ncbi:hypothetical protein FF38_10732 [Lucilia cuprina]|uniref:Uncharacterized protein n=1 Tax=Lucilia cuprina TaxID=7375 RepID=A0A0L0BTG0_LUCCU|nr:hypothetical protein FF38_10732 [Lucilia cuprina]